MKKIIFYELNEVPFKVLDFYADLFPKSAFAKLRNTSQAFETYSEDTGHLSPWITWPTLHRGITNDNHEISDFGQNLEAVNREYPPIWDILSKKGVKVGLFGSLHSYPLPDNIQDYAFYVPDTFAAGPECFPKKFESFQDFNLKMAGNNASQVNRGIAMKEAAKFLLAAPNLGLTPRTIGKIGQQIINERLKPHSVVRRRTTQVQLAFDFYYNELNRSKPDISFFFTNHVASSMHRYWPAVFPEDYENLAYDSDWVKKWSGEIPFTMQEANYQIGKLISFVEKNPDYKLILATSMGQAAVQGRSMVKKKVIVTSLKKLMSGLEIDEGAWEKRPAMVPQYNVYVEKEYRDKFRQNIGGLDINGKSFEVDDLGDGVFRLNFGLVNQDHLTTIYKGQAIDPKSIGIVNIDMQDAAGANAYHIPQGMLISYDPESITASNNRNKISTVEIAPTILKNFNVEKPSYMVSTLL